MSKKPDVPNPAASTLWTPDDVAAYLRCSKRHVANLVKAGMPHLNIGRLQRFRKEAVDSFLNANPRLSLSNRGSYPEKNEAEHL